VLLEQVASVLTVWYSVCVCLAYAMSGLQLMMLHTFRRGTIGSLELVASIWLVSMRLFAADSARIESKLHSDLLAGIATSHLSEESMAGLANTFLDIGRNETAMKLQSDLVVEKMTTTQPFEKNMVGLSNPLLEIRSNETEIKLHSDLLGGRISTTQTFEKSIVGLSNTLLETRSNETSNLYSKSMLENPLEKKIPGITLLEKPFVRATGVPPQVPVRDLHLMVSLDFLNGKGRPGPYNFDKLFSVELFGTKLRIYSTILTEVAGHGGGFVDVDFPADVDVDPSTSKMQYNQYGLHQQDGYLFGDHASPKLVVDVRVCSTIRKPSGLKRSVAISGKDLNHVHPIVDSMTKEEFNHFIEHGDVQEFDSYQDNQA